ncbi:YrhB domain-containing protein [Actinoplanes xinjiangensis]|jgi:hypothetical protein|uniref:Immunity protein 35 of polymorphic toxin system n=1 Tax=Actinoplanes xinjiangensis TaxID=512350 RepID=A0A316FPR4_9ACTN|nr:YrhB domain-containing protein [Actinoplanes xinjiangensis]PWK49696.1 immunity protein 35 of polymorphic toxin system [Actinoplanes xinjiangensis]GIF37702.1 hypothetical protein Axi01nite_20130 [Actinoplanes xinjiangensis]
MVSLDEARAAAERFLDLQVRPQHPYTVVILGEYVEDEGDAWLFPYNGTGYIERNDPTEMMLGNYPIRVLKETGAADFSEQ